MAYVVSLTELSRQNTAMSMTNLTQGRRSLLHRSWGFIASFFYEEFCHSKNQASNIVSHYSYHIFIRFYSYKKKSCIKSCDATRSCLRKPWPSCFEGDESVQKSIDPQRFELWGCCSTACVGIAMTFFILSQSFSYIFLFALFLIVFLHITLVYLPCPIPW